MPQPDLYLDYAATSPLLPEVAAAMSELFPSLISGEIGNPSALHAAGQRAQHLLESARADVAALIGADPDEIIFTSGGSEANNTVINIFAGQPIAISAIEHPSVLEPARALAQPLTIIPVDEWGMAQLDKLYAMYASYASYASYTPDAPPQPISAPSINGSHQDYQAVPSCPSPPSCPDSQPPALISVMLANNELGTIEPVAALASRCDDAARTHTSAPRAINKTYIHTDATQAVGKIPVNVHALGVDYLTLSAHKIGGPVGIGALYVRRGAPFRPLIRGGHQETPVRNQSTFLSAPSQPSSHSAPSQPSSHSAPRQSSPRPSVRQFNSCTTSNQPSSHSASSSSCTLPNRPTPRSYSGGRRAGTSNALLAHGFGVAARRARERLKDYRQVSRLRDALRARILAEVPYTSLNSPAKNCLPNIVNASFQAAEGESIQLYLGLAGIQVSTGSACASGSLDPSHVLMATRHDAEVAHSSIRFSLSPETTRTDLDRLMSVLPEIVRRLQGISTVQIQERKV